MGFWLVGAWRSGKPLQDGDAMTMQRLLILLTAWALGLATSLPATAQNTTANKTTSSTAVPPPTIADLVLLLQSYKPDLARTQKLRDQMNAAVPDSNDAVTLARAWHAKAIAAEELGEEDKRYEYLIKAQDYATASASSSLNEVGSLLRIQQDLTLATSSVMGIGAGIDVLEKFIANNRVINLGASITAFTHLSQQLANMGDLDRANAILKETVISANSMAGKPNSMFYGTTWNSFIEATRGYLLLSQGKLDDAERSYKASLRVGDQMVKDHERARAMGRFAMPAERAESSQLMRQRQLALTYIGQGRLDEAELLLRDALKTALSRQGRSSPVVGMILGSLGQVYVEKGRGPEAVVIGEWAQRAFSEAGFAPNSAPRLVLSKFLAGVYTSLGRYQEATKLQDELRQIAAQEARHGREFEVSDIAQVRALLGVGRAADALSVSDLLLARSLKRMGPDHYQTGEVRGVRAVALQAVGRGDEARKEFEQSVHILLEAGAATNTKGTASLLTQNRKKAILNSYVDLLAGPQAKPGEADLSEAFRLADVARWQSVQKALSGSALRSAAGTPELGAKIKKVQDDEDELQAVYKNLIAQRSAPPDKQLPAVIAAMEKRIAELKKEQAQSLVEIRRQFPQYDALVNPKPADLSATLKALQPNETLVSIYVTPTGTYVWALKGGASGAEAMKFHYSAQGRDWLNERVKKLRDNTDLTTGLSADRMRFDLKAAHELYQALLGPVASTWDKSDTLLVVANDSLGQIPFSLLTTEPVTLGRAEGGLVGSQYRQVPWLARKVAVSYLPSVSALVTLRALQPSTATRAPFLGFGDPDFGQSATQVASATSRGMRNMEEKRVARWDENVLSADKAPPPSALVEEAPELSPLPDTRDEILAIAKALAADGEGSEAVSGLGRGFFYAGAKSVLATHWPVETVSARQLVTHLFERYAKDPAMTRAKALQRAMLEVLDKEVASDGSGKPLNAYAHPAFWAPYALYGDPGR